MLRFALLLFVALTAFVAAGPTVRKDEVTNAVTATVDTEMKPSVSQEEPAKEPQAPVKRPVSNDEQVPSTVMPTTESTVAPTTTTTPPVTSSSTTTVSITTPTKSPTTAATGVLTATKPPRKTITFDQRQEGKYNIRADLENFVIVVVPSGSTSGASLLDLLTRSAQKKEVHQTRKASHKRKNNKAHGGVAHHKKAAQVTPEVIVLDENNQRSGQLEAEEFIEGRTPYKVDLSSSARSVDIDEVPMASGRVVRFPGASGNYPQPYDGRATADGRAGRALRVGGYQHPYTNTLVVAVPTNNHILPGDGDHQQRDGTNQSPLLLLHRSGDDDNATDNAGTGVHNELVVHYPLVDHDSHHPSSFDSLVYEPLRSDVDMTQLQLQPDDRYDDLEQSDADTDGLDDGWDELRLLGAQEQCGPDRKRDSYGVCQFVQP